APHACTLHPCDLSLPDLKLRRCTRCIALNPIGENMSETPTSSNGLNTSATHEASLDRSQIGSPADGRKLNGSGEQGTGVNSGIAASQNSEVRPVIVKQTGHKTITGSNPGDHRAPSQDTAKAPLNSAADNGGPRNRVGQFDKPSTGAPVKYGSGSG